MFVVVKFIREPGIEQVRKRGLPPLFGTTKNVTFVLNVTLEEMLI
jgi:hypothetical protein